MGQRMKAPTDEEIQRQLVDIISDGFNRSLAALEKADAIDTDKLRVHYTGMGSQYYDVVTDQIVLTAKYCVPAVRKLFEKTTQSNETK